MRFRCVTFGCRVNQYETQAVREQMIRRGHTESPEGSPPDLLVVNSCTVTESADRECIAFVRAFHRDHPQARIVLAGCLVQRDSARLKGLPGVRLLLGSNQKHRIADLLGEMKPGEGESSSGGSSPWIQDLLVETEMDRIYAPLQISAFAGRSKAFVKAQDGCDRCCAFCAIPCVRGRSRSRPLGDLLDEVRRLVDRGFEEVVLTGVALGLWGKEWDPPRSLADLIRAVDSLPGRFRVRLSSLDPRDLDEEMIEALRSSKRLCRHLHLALQSGSDSVLRRMNRGASASEVRFRVGQVRRFWPDLGLTTDLIVGFPGETEEEFQETLEFCREMVFARVHLFPYSRRQGTSAWFFKGQVPPAVIKSRARRLRQAAVEVSRCFQRGFVGTVQEMLLEEGGKGYTGQFLEVRLAGAADPAAAGRLQPVRLKELAPEGLVGELVNFSGAPLDNCHRGVPSLEWKGKGSAAPLTKANHR